MSKNSGISRRDAIVLTGTGLLAASCSPRQESEESTKGIWPSVGDNPNEPGIDNPIKSKFKPNYVTLVRVTSGKGWEVSASHASFWLGQVSDAERMDFAINTFARFRKDVGGLKKINQFRDMAQDRNTKIRERKGHDGHGNAHNNDVQALDFKDFRFGFQHEIFVWFDGADVGLHSDKNGNAHFIAIGPLLSTGETGTINKSFYARKGENTSTTGETIAGPMIAIRNYHFNGLGKPVEEGKEHSYAISIYFTVPSSNGQRMLLLLDPDTGNGVGYDP
jgi:hypothetical protein